MKQKNAFIISVLQAEFWGNVSIEKTTLKAVSEHEES